MSRTLNDLTSPEAVQASLDEFLRLGQTEFLRKHGFGKASGYLVRDPRTGLWADSKAIAGVALAYQWPGEPALKATRFSGGAATVVAKLERLGFVVQRRQVMAGEHWRREEVELIVADYLTMLLAELAGQAYNKSTHRRQLLSRLPGRSAGAVEFKHCNISAVMLELGCPYLQGYQPRHNFQRNALVEVVSMQVARHAQLDAVALSAVERPAVPSAHPDYAQVMTLPPDRKRVPQVRENAPASEVAPVRRDYLAREEHNRSLGLAGELFVLEFERWRLIQQGAGQLAERVRHVAAEEGDGLGFDIHSFDSQGRDRFVEVKTTSFGDRTPFFISANELRFARAQPQSFRLCRLFDFRKAPRMFELAGPVEQHCQLDATTFRASFG